jgi:mobilization protein NikA
MNEENLVALSFKVSADEAEVIQAAADKEGISRSEYLRNAISKYIRNRMRTPADAPTGNLEALLRHLIYMESRTHIALYSIHEMAGTLSTGALKEVYEHAVSETLKYMVALPDRIAKAQAQIATEANSATATANGTTGAANGEQVRRCSDPQHARLFGDGECFICHVPIEARL